jgi:hypothetical protein
MIQALRKEGIGGFHLCTLNLEKSVTRVLEKLDWLRPLSPNPTVNFSSPAQVHGLMKDMGAA